MTDLTERFNAFVQNQGRAKALAWLDRMEPECPEAFIRRLYDDLHAILRRLEEMKEDIHEEGECSLRNRVATSLRDMGYSASREEDCNGHTDFLVRCEPVRLIWIGEAKVFKTAYGHLTEGMKQLLTRYSPGTHRHVGLVVFVTSPDCRHVITEWRTRITDEEICDPIGEPEKPEDENPLSFASTHKHPDSGLAVRTQHFFAAIHYLPQDKSAVEARAKKV